MHRILVVGLYASLVLSVFIGIAEAQQDGTKFDSKGDTQTYLSLAVEDQQVVIALGQLAAQRAENTRVKEFGAQMVNDHKKVRREAEQLASRHTVPLPTKLTTEDKQKVEELSQLSGHAFDRAYMNFALQNHEATLEEFRHHVNTLKYPDLREYFTATLPMLESHVEQARKVKNSLQTNP